MCWELMVMSLDTTPIEDYKKHAEQSAELAALDRAEIEAGMKSGNIAGVIETASAAAKSAQESMTERSERKAKERFDDALLLALLNNGELDSFVAENIFGGMSDGEVMDVVSMIEAETGKSFEEYARNILGDDMPDRAHGETDADYNRRVLILVTPEVLNENLSIRPGFENDPLARYVRGHEVTRVIRNQIGELDHTAQVHGVEVVIDGATIEADNDVIFASLMGAEAENNELAIIGVDRHDGHRDTDAHNDADVNASSSFLSGGFPSSLASASSNFSTQFASAAVDAHEAQAVVPINTPVFSN